MRSRLSTPLSTGFGVTYIATNPKLLFCGNLICVGDCGDPLGIHKLKDSSSQQSPTQQTRGFGHAYRFAFDVATNHVANQLRWSPDSQAKVVRWPVAEKVAKLMANWWCGVEHPPIYVPGSKILRAEQKRGLTHGWATKHLELEGYIVLDVDQDIRNTVPNMEYLEVMQAEALTENQY